MQKRLSPPAALAFLFALAACSGTAIPTTASTPAGTAVTVAVEPPTALTAPGGTVVFAAVVTGSVSTAVRWAVREPTGGTVDASGRYVAPAGAGVFHVEATSEADPGVTAAATVTVTAPPPPPVVVVAVTPPSGAVDACHSLALSASVTGAANTAVTWSVLEGAAGGVVTSAGVYTAPSTAGVYHAVATSVADPTKSATATLTVSERVLAVVVSPATISVAPGGTAQLTATVTTTCGNFASTATVNGAGQVVAN